MHNKHYVKQKYRFVQIEIKKQLIYQRLIVGLLRLFSIYSSTLNLLGAS